MSREETIVALLEARERIVVTQDKVITEQKALIATLRQVATVREQIIDAQKQTIQELQAALLDVGARRELDALTARLRQTDTWDHANDWKFQHLTGGRY